MDRRQLFFGLAIVFGGFGLLSLAAPEIFYGRGTFYERNYGIIRLSSVASLLLGGVFVVLGRATRRS